MGATAHCSAVVRGSIPRGCADYITSAYPNRDHTLNNRLAGIGHNSKTHVYVEPRRNDPLLNNYSTTMSLEWRANIDIKLVISKDTALKSV
jgi:hypothetical protein